MVHCPQPASRAAFYNRVHGHILQPSPPPYPASMPPSRSARITSDVPYSVAMEQPEAAVLPGNMVAYERVTSTRHASASTPMPTSYVAKTVLFPADDGPPAHPAMTELKFRTGNTYIHSRGALPSRSTFPQHQGQRCRPGVLPRTPVGTYGMLVCNDSRHPRPLPRRIPCKPPAFFLPHNPLMRRF